MFIFGERRRLPSAKNRKTPTTELFFSAIRRVILACDFVFENQVSASYVCAHQRYEFAYPVLASASAARWTLLSSANRRTPA